MRFREWYPSKSFTEQSVLSLVSLLRETQWPDFFLGWITLLVHVVGGLSLVVLLLFFPLNSLYGLFCLAWCIVILSNAYFHGCILSRVERHLFHSDTWYGPVSLGNFLFQLLFTKVTKDIANFVIKYCFAVPVSVVVLLRLASSSDMGWILLSLFLGGFFSMFAFESSQKLCIDAIFDALQKLEEPSPK
jgi:hypothetical protein